MSLRLILGRAGSGKTKICIEEMQYQFKLNPTDEYIILSPEQSTYSLEKRLLNTFENGAAMNIRALSFHRLNRYIFNLLGKGALPVINKSGKALILRAVLEEVKNSLSNYKRVYKYQGFINQLVSIIDEFRNYRITPDEIFEISKDSELTSSINSLTGLGLKLADLYLIYSGYVKAIEGNYQDSALELELLSDTLSSFDKLDNHHFWIDGFHGFTPSEYKVIGALLKSKVDVTLTLNLDPGMEETEIEDEHLFYPTWETYHQIKEFCEKENIIIKNPIYLPTPDKVRFKDSKCLGYLEKAMVTNTAFEDLDTSEINMSLLPNMKNEVEKAAYEIREKAKEGIRYNQMTVLVRNIEDYSLLFESVFSMWNIPCFIDVKKSLVHHPLCVLISNLMPFLTNTYNSSTILSCIKTGLFDITDEDCDFLENYVLKAGIKPYYWEMDEPWEFIPEKNEEIKKAMDKKADKLRKTVYLPIYGLLNSLSSCNTVKDALIALYGILEALDIPNKLSLEKDKLIEKGFNEEAEIYEKAWSSICEMLEQINTYMGEKPLDNNVLSQVILSAIDNMEVALVPPTIDQVTITTLDRSKTQEMSYVWILGANQDILPGTENTQGLLDKEERKVLNALGLNLAPDSERILFSEQYLIYIALTRANKGLYISAPRSNGSDKAKFFSGFILDILTLIKGVTLNENFDETINYSAPMPALISLGKALSLDSKDKIDEEYISWLYNWFNSNSKYSLNLERIIKGWEIKARIGVLSPEVSTELFGDVITTSVSQLETFYNCPFQHFLQYGLRLKERDIYTVDTPEIGTFCHDAMELLLDPATLNNKELNQYSDEEIEEIVGKVTGNILKRTEHNKFMSSSKYKFIANNLKMIVLATAKTIKHQEDVGKFRTKYREIGFGMNSNENNLDPITINIDENKKIMLRGRIDRIDTYTDSNNNTYYRVVDYKSSNHKLNLWEINEGLKLQLLLYSHVAKNIDKDSNVAGMYYYQMQRPDFEVTNRQEYLLLDEEKINKETFSKTKLSGYTLKDTAIVNAMEDINKGTDVLGIKITKEGEFYKGSNVLSKDQWEKIDSLGMDKLVSSGKEIMKGNISVLPYAKKDVAVGCSYCNFKGICMYDPTIPDNHCRKVNITSDENILSKIMEANNNDR